MERHQEIHARSVGRKTGVAMLLVALVAAGCASRRYTVEVPARLDLHRFGRVGLVQFTVEKARGSLHEAATARFTEAILSAQNVEVLELRPEDIRLHMEGEKELGPGPAREICLTRNVPALFAGHLVVSNVKPSGGGVSLLGLKNPFVEATVSVELSVRLLSGESGATLWRASGAATEKVGQVGMNGDDVFFSAKNPNDAYGELVNRLVMKVTGDMRPSWETRRMGKS